MTSHKHQFSVIAKVDDRYRVLSTVRCSYPSALAILRRCLGTIKIFQDVANRMPIQQELQAAKGFAALCPEWDREWHADVSKSIPLPFITTCLIVGTSFTFDEGWYFEAVCQHLRTWLAVGLVSVSGTVFFDITDLDRVYYAFECSYYGSRGVKADFSRPMISMSASTFLQQHYAVDDPETEALFAPLLASLNRCGLLPASTLRSIWPLGEQDTPSFSEGTIQTYTATPSNPIRSLTSIAVDATVQIVVDGLIQKKDLLPEEALELTDFRLALRSKLQKIGHDLQECDATIQVIYEAFADCAEVDLSPFRNLSTDGLSLIVTQLQEHGRITTLGLSNRSDLTLAGVENILGTECTLTTLCLLANPKLSSTAGGKLWNRFDVHHSDHIRLPITFWPEKLMRAPFLPIRPLSEIVWVYGATASRQDASKNREDSPAFEPDDLKYWKWPLDLPPRPIKVITGFLRLLRWAAQSFIENRDQFGKGAALSLALASSRKLDSGLEVGCLSNIIYTHANGALKKNTFHRLQSGEWAFVILHEGFDVPSQAMKDEAQREQRMRKNASRDPHSSEQQQQSGKLHEIHGRKGVRYALAQVDTCPENPRPGLALADVPQYLKQVMGDSLAGDDELTAQELGEWWRGKIAGMDNVEYCGEDEMRKVVKKVYADNYKWELVYCPQTKDSALRQR